ncbi:hypothetical protein ACFOPN_05840 [Xanthomonas hyacinthi]|uniref:hypothetical protein n=1 Tax=Xanthomonas hyacinthi TaxID=56455 RepID=UPI00361F85F3
MGRGAVCGAQPATPPRTTTWAPDTATWPPVGIGQRPGRFEQMACCNSPAEKPRRPCIRSDA